jgi:hypothetical protein
MKQEPGCETVHTDVLMDGFGVQEEELRLNARCFWEEDRLFTEVEMAQEEQGEILPSAESRR